jgi:hypothetical protein
MSTLSEILQRARQPAAKAMEEAEEYEQQDIQYTNGSVGQQGYDKPNPYLFVAIYRPFLKNPTAFDALTFREYKNWLLSPSYYVLNTFAHFDTSTLSNLIMKNIGKQTHMPAISFHNIAMLLWDIELNVPASYMETFEDIASYGNEVI